MLKKSNVKKKVRYNPDLIQETFKLRDSKMGK
jgi:hypothetical protein